MCRALVRLTEAQESQFSLALTAVEGLPLAAAYLNSERGRPLSSATLLDCAPHRLWTSLEHRSHRFVKRTDIRSFVSRASRWSIARTLRWQRAIASRLPAFRPEAVDIFHSPALIPIPRYVSRARRPACFLTFYDLIPFHYANDVTPESIAVLQRTLTGFDPARHFAICISNHVKEDVCEHLKLDPTRAFVTPLAADQSCFYPCNDVEQIISVRRRYGLDGDRPYLLSLCAVEPRKNLVRLVKCFARIRKEDHEARDVQLVLVGQASEQAIRLLRELVAAESLKDCVVLTGYVEDCDLAPIYSGALAFVFPSLAEGFGLPPLEAMQCGTPVISSNRTSLPEVVGDAGLMVDPTDDDALCQAMLIMLRNPEIRRDYGERGLVRSGLFSWRRCAESHLEAYRASV